MARHPDEYTINELLVGAIKHLKRVADGIDAQNEIQRAYLAAEKKAENKDSSQVIGKKGGVKE